MPGAARIAFAFPGQGSQKVGMGRDLSRARRVVADTFREADRVLGFSLSALCWEGPEADLALTVNTQPALLTVSTAIARLLDEQGVRPEIVLGHSLGEYSAQVAAGGLAFADALVLVRARGRYMQAAVPLGQGAMAAVVGLGAAQVEALCEEARLPDEVLGPANYNGAAQVVVAGHAASVERIIEAAARRGARRAMRLPVSAPFHCALMRPAEEKLARDLDNVRFGDLRVPLITNVDARPVTRAAEGREALRRQVSAPVRWEESVRRLREHEVATVVEVGAGRVLGGLIRRIDENLRVHAVEDEKSFKALLEALAGEAS